MLMLIQLDFFANTNTNTTMQKYKYLFGRSVCRTTTCSLIAADIALSGPEGRGRISLGMAALLPANNCIHKHPIKDKDKDKDKDEDKDGTAALRPANNRIHKHPIKGSDE